MIADREGDGFEALFFTRTGKLTEYQKQLGQEFRQTEDVGPKIEPAGMINQRKGFFRRPK